jgi:putative transposase
VMDEPHLMSAVRYVERNPVRARLVARPEDWPWSSAAAHLGGADDGLVRVAPMLKLVRDWTRYLADPDDEEVSAKFRRHEATGRPMGSDSFIARLEALVGRLLRPQKRGPKSKKEAN